MPTRKFSSLSLPGNNEFISAANLADRNVCPRGFYIIGGHNRDSNNFGNPDIVFDIIYEDCDGLETRSSLSLGESDQRQAIVNLFQGEGAEDKIGPLDLKKVNLASGNSAWNFIDWEPEPEAESPAKSKRRR